MHKTFLLSTFLLFIAIPSKSQTVWTLQDCIDYVSKNGISIKEADVQRRLSVLGVEGARGSFWPTLSFSSSAGYHFGLTENPTTGILASSNFFGNGYSFSANATLFNWFSRRHTLRAAKAASEADAFNIKKVQDEAVLALSAAYLQVLLAKELSSSARFQVQQTAVQAEAVRKKILVGILSGLDAAQLHQQLIADSIALVATLETYNKALLQLKGVMSLDAQQYIMVQPLPVNDSPAIALLAITPEELFKNSLRHLPNVKSLHRQIDAAYERVKAAKALRYPTLSVYATAGSNFVNIVSAQSFVYLPQQPTGSKVSINGVSYDVFAPGYSVGSYGVTPFFRQLQKNFGQNIGISINIPILNGKNLTLNQKREELNLSQVRLQNERFLQDLKILVYTAQEEAITAWKKVSFFKRLLTDALTVFEAAKKRYGLNLLSTQDFLLAQNALQKAKTDELMAQYDFVFKLKLLELYNGQE